MPPRLRMISSVSPSTKSPLPGSSLRFLNGSTAMIGCDGMTCPAPPAFHPATPASSAPGVREDPTRLPTVSQPSPAISRRTAAAAIAYGSRASVGRGWSVARSAANASALAYRRSGRGSIARSMIRASFGGRSERPRAVRMDTRSLRWCARRRSLTVSRADRVRAGHQVIEKDTQTVDVTLDGGVAPGKDFRRQIEGRPGDIRAEVVRKLSSRAEVHQHGPAVVGEHHVLRLDIAMQYAGAVHGGNGMSKARRRSRRLPPH